MNFINLLVTFLYSVVVVHSARILGITNIPSISQQVVFRPLWRELSLRGHQLTVLTTDPMKDHSLVNLTEIDMHLSYNIGEETNYIEMMDEPLWSIWYDFVESSSEFVDKQLSLPQVQKLINDPSEHFDILIVEGFHSAHFAFGERFKCPFIPVLSLDANSFMHEEIGNPANYGVYPDYWLEYHGKLSFGQRLKSTLYNLYLRYINMKLLLPAQQELVKKHFGTHYSPIQTIYKNFSAFFLNLNHVVHPVRPLLPNVISIGGLTHISKSKPLPENLQNILDKSTEGVIYFSLGSNAKSKHISNGTLKAIMSVFRELPYTVLWKFENDRLPDKPSNVFISKWFPQQDVLKHPAIKVFITQGGLQSLDEALNANVPLIGIPVLGDQVSNVLGIAAKGLGVMLEYKSITEESLKSAILEVIQNPKYRENVKMYADLVLDQAQTGLEKAVWWTEYVIRHKGTPHLRNPAFDLSWFEYYLLDVIAFLFGVTAIVSYLIYKLLSTLIKLTKRVLFRSKQKQM